MGHSDDCISFSKTRVAATHYRNLTLPVRHASPPTQSILPLLVSGLPLRRNATDFPQDISAAHVYPQSLSLRDAISSSAVTGDSRYRSARNSTGASSPLQIPGNLPYPNPAVLSQRQYKAFQAPAYPPTTVAPSYTATTQSYGDVGYASGLRDRVSLPVQISGGVPNTNSAMDNHVLSQQQYKVFQDPTYPPKSVAPSYTATAQSYGEDTYASEPWYRISPPVQISDGVPNTIFAVDNPVLSEQQYRVLQAPTYPPTTVAPSYNTTARYGGDATYAAGMGGTSSPSSSSAYSFQDGYPGLDVDLPTHMSDGISRRYLMVDSDPSLQGTAFQKSISSSIVLPPSYGSHIVQSYTDDASHIPLASNPTLIFSNSDHSTCGLAPQFPSPSIPTTPTSRSPHLNALYQTPLAGHNYQTMTPREQGGQQPLAYASQVFIIDGCRIEGVDLVDHASADGNITIGQCLRTDSLCNLWVRADKGSLKRHLKKWHGVPRGGDSNKVSCTWQGCNMPMQKSAVPRHIMRKHFNETFKCNGCDKDFTRYECWKNHTPKCAFSGLGWTVRYGDGTRIINVLGMSLSQGS